MANTTQTYYPLRPVSNSPKEQPWPRRRIVGGRLAIIANIAAEVSPIATKARIHTVCRSTTYARIGVWQMSTGSK